MKKYLFLIPLAAALMASCSKEEVQETPAKEPAVYVKDGISIFAQSTPLSKVSVNLTGEEDAFTGSQMAWENGDRITVFHDGKTYEYVTDGTGAGAAFHAVDDANKITEVTTTKPVIAYYNVSSVSSTDGTATFSVPAVQTEGDATNKVPLYAYTATPDVTGETLTLTFKPVVSVLEFGISAAPASALDGFAYNLTKVVLTPKSGATGWTAMTGGSINPATGVVTPAGESVSAMTLNFASSTDIATPLGSNTRKHFQIVLGPCQMNNTGATLDWYKGEILNYTKEMWADKNVSFATKPIHAYQPIAQKVVGLANYNDYYTKFYANRNSQDKLINYCDDERTIILTGDIYLVSGNTHRVVVFPNLAWNIDGKGHSLFAFNVTDEKRVTCFFSGVQANIKNLNFGREGYDAIFNITDNNNGGGYAPIADVISGTIENVTSFINYTVTVGAANKATYLGGIVANMKGGTIKGCNNKGSLNLILKDGVTTSATLIAGGIVANSGGSYTIENCHNYAPVAVTANSTNAIYSAGIVGAISPECTLTGSENHGTISATNTNTTDQSTNNNAQCRAAGILGRVPSCSDAAKATRITNCTNYGNVIGSIAAPIKTFYNAGIIADFQVGNITSGCVQRGNVTATKAGAEDNAAIGWFSVWAGSNPESASVLKGVKINSYTIDESNYNKRNYWSRNNDPGTLTLITE